MRKNCAELTHFSDVAMMLVFTSFALKVHMSRVTIKPILSFLPTWHGCNYNRQQSYKILFDHFAQHIFVPVSRIIPVSLGTGRT